MSGFIVPALLFLLLTGFAGYAILEYGNIVDLDIQKVIDNMIKTDTTVSRKNRLKSLTPTEQQAELAQDLRSNLIALNEASHSIINKHKKQLNRTVRQKDDLLSKLFSNTEVKEEETINKLITDSQDIIDELEKIQQAVSNRTESVDNENKTDNQGNITTNCP